jgi:chromate transporter
MLYVSILGWQAAGFWGALATTVALAVPPFTLTLLVMHLSSRFPGSRLGRAFRVGFAPITIGLMYASGWVLVRSVDTDVRSLLATVVTVVVVFRSRMNPLWLIAAGAAAGVGGVL